MIFFTVAYVSISTDVTGIFDYTAYKIAFFSKGNGVKLFFYFYLFACLLTAFTSNDIVILTLTPIIFYLGKHAKINIVPLLFAEFFGANTLSMVLYIGNPTNIIVGNALMLGFWQYSKVMWLPTIVATVPNVVFLGFYFRKNLSQSFKLNNKSTVVVRNWFDAILSVCLLILMFLALAFSSYLRVPIWEITLLFAVIFMAEDIFFGLYYLLKEIEIPSLQREKLRHFQHIPKEKNEFWLAIKRMPWKIFPFIILFFILVEALNHYGVIQILAHFIAQMSTTPLRGILSMGTFSIITANIINNQPMTILFSYVLTNNAFAVSPQTLMGSAYALIIASNLGANITLVGALAGLMWKKILSDKGVEISYWDFLKVGLIITPVVFYATLLILYFVVR